MKSGGKRSKAGVAGKRRSLNGGRAATGAATGSSTGSSTGGQSPSPAARSAAGGSEGSAAGQTPKSLIVFFDGTSNEDSDPQKYTNIVRIRDLIDTSDGKAAWFYTTGVGAHSNSYCYSNDSPDNFVDGKPPKHYYDTYGKFLYQLNLEFLNVETYKQLWFGASTLLRVKTAYKWLCQHYNKEDSIYVFGFSRGAFSARTFASFVGIAGIVDSSLFYKPGRSGHLDEGGYKWHKHACQPDNGGCADYTALESRKSYDSESPALPPHLTFSCAQVKATTGFGLSDAQLQAVEQVKTFDDAVDTAMLTCTSACRLGRGAFDDYDPAVEPQLDEEPTLLVDIINSILGLARPIVELKLPMWLRNGLTNRLREIGWAKPALPQLSPPDFRRLFSLNHDERSVNDLVKVNMCGVFDTVPAVRRQDLDWFSPLLGESVKHGYHALSLDEPRSTFKLLLWDRPEKRSDHSIEQKVEQTWFAGSHGDVGGGWGHVDGSPHIHVQRVADSTHVPEWLIDSSQLPPPPNGPADPLPGLYVSADVALAIVALSWMLEKAEKHKVPLKPGWRLKPSSLVLLSQEGYEHSFETFRWRLGAPKYTVGPTAREIDSTLTKLHVSVIARMAHPHAKYAPVNPEAKKDITAIAATHVHSDVGEVTWYGHPSKDEKPTEHGVSHALDIKSAVPQGAAQLRKITVTDSHDTAGHHPGVDVVRLGQSDAWSWLVSSVRGRELPPPSRRQHRDGIVRNATAAARPVGSRKRAAPATPLGGGGSGSTTSGTGDAKKRRGVIP